jgi:hypothetical protein
VRLRPLVLLTVAAVLLPACGSDEPSADTAGTSPTASATSESPPPSPSLSGEPSPTTTPSPTSEGTGPEGVALIALCEVETDLEQGDIDQAAATFEDEVHETLHELADQLEAVDRKVAAALLVAKAKVEAGFADPSVQAPALRRAVEALIVEMRAAMTALDLDQPACAA